MVKSLNRGLLRSCWCQEEPSDILLHCRWLTFHHGLETVTWSKNTLLAGKRRSGANLGSMAVLVACANKTRWGQWLGCSWVVHPTKPPCYAGFSRARKTEITSPFFSRSHCIICQPARWFLYHATAREPAVQVYWPASAWDWVSVLSHCTMELFRVAISAITDCRYYQVAGAGGENCDKVP